MALCHIPVSSRNEGRPACILNHVPSEGIQRPPEYFKHGSLYYAQVSKERQQMKTLNLMIKKMFFSLESPLLVSHSTCLKLRGGPLGVTIMWLLPGGGAKW